jgi:hypothetical protein
MQGAALHIALLAQALQWQLNMPSSASAAGATGVPPGRAGVKPHAYAVLVPGQQLGRLAIYIYHEWIGGTDLDNPGFCKKWELM